MNESSFDNWMRRRAEIYNNEPRWQRAIGNFGFGFIFLGFLSNLALFVLIVLITDLDSTLLYHPWWITYVLVSSLIGGWWAIFLTRWRRHR